MARVLSVFLWALVFCVTILMIDQLFVHVPMTTSGFAESRRFYLEFRQRLLSLRDSVPEATSIEAIIDQNAAIPAAPSATKPAPALRSDQPSNLAPQASVANAAPVTEAVSPKATAAVAPVSAPVRKSSPAAAKKSTGYVYADAQGELHFVDRLDQVPERYRREAQSLGN
jgi:hypothetical protein